jgi:hypothetical protein
MTGQQLIMAVGYRDAVSFMKLKSDLADSIRIYRLHQTVDFGGTAPEIGAKDVCPCCGQYIQEGLLH